MAGPRRPLPGCYCRTAAAVNLLLGVFQVLLPCCRPGGAQGQALEPLPNVVELWQAEEGELLVPTQGDSEEDLEARYQEQSFSDRPRSGGGLHFQPSALDFGIQFLGQPAAKVLHAYNPSRESEVVVNSVFTAARHLHVPPVHCRVIPALGKTSFRIIFLPTEEGSLESSLFINTSSYGVLSYHVSGVGTRRSSPEGSAKQPANTHFLLPQIQSIRLSRTQAETTNASLLQVQLECSLHNSVCQQFMSCPLEAEDVLRLQMSITVMENASKELEENTQDLLDHLAVVYVATEKSEVSGDSTVNMYVLHSGSSLLWIQDVHHLSQREVPSLQFEPVLLPTSTTNFTKIASFTCKAPTCGMKEDVKKTKNTPTLNSCLSFPVVHGYFRMDASSTQFHLEAHENTSGVWSLWCFNHLDRPVVLNGVFVSKEAKHMLKILNFTGPLFLPPGCWNILSLKLVVKDIATNLFTNVFLTTNIGAIFAIPLQIYSALTKEGSLGFEVIAHCGMHYFMGKSKAGNPLWEGSISLDRSTWNIDSELADKLYERWKRLRSGGVCKRNVLGMTRFAPLKKPKEVEPFVYFLPRLPAEPGLVLNFSAIALRNSVVKYFLLRNPSSRPLWLQLLPLSSYPAPEAAGRLLHKWFGVDMQMMNFTTGEFQLTEACPYQGLHPEGRGLASLLLQLQPLETSRVGVVFTPADYGRVTSLLLIRNNLTVFDLIVVEGFGARELLRVGGKLPGAGGSLRFKVPESTLMDCHRQLKDSKQILSITKNFKVENIGPVRVTVTSLRINGYNCQGYGFQVLDCRPFSLDPNASQDISIVFTPDFTSSWVIRQLTLVTAAHLEFHFTLNVTLPHHLLPLCADVVPGPSWEEAFWRLTVFFVSLSLVGVILIAFQQAQYILLEFMKTRQRQGASSSPQPDSSQGDVLSPHPHRSNCKNFLDTYSPCDKGRGKSCLPVSPPPQSRFQNAAKRSPGTYGHSQKKHKCSVYYSKHKPSTSVLSGANAEEKQSPVPGSPLPPPRVDGCAEMLGENWVNLRYARGMDVSLQKNLALPRSFLNKEENTLKATASVSPSEFLRKEGTQPCMFPKETEFHISESLAEPKERAELSPLKTAKKLPENHWQRNSPPFQPDLPEMSRKDAGNNQQVPVKTKVDCETLKKGDAKPCSEKKVSRASKEEACAQRQDLPSSEQEDSYRKKKLQEKKEGNLLSLSCNKNRVCRKNKKRGAPQLLRPSELSEPKLVGADRERCKPSSASDQQNWAGPESSGEAEQTDAALGSSRPTAQGEADAVPPESGAPPPCPEKTCSDSSSDCGSSVGSVRASRGSWGSWSSTSSADGDRKAPVVGAPHFLSAGDSVSPSDFAQEAPISVNLSHDNGDVTDVTSFPQHAESPCPSLPTEPAGVEEDKGLYRPGDLWPAQPLCVTGGFNCALESSVSRVLQGPAPVPASGFIDWNAACEGQFPSMYCPLDLNDYNAFPEENMNYPNGFPCPADMQTDFMDPGSQSAWNTAPSMPTAWGHASLISSPPYLTSTRSLSPMSGLFGSIWAPQSDVYENCCPLGPTTEHPTHMESQAVMCKEYYLGFNPFRAYMNLDIWTSPADSSPSFPLPRDPSYCGNV